MNPQITQMSPAEAARMFVRDELAVCQLSVVSDQPQRTTDSGPLTRECSICELPKPAAGFRQVVGRNTTEACAECCDRRDAADGTLVDPLGPTAIAQFCLHVAEKRFARRNACTPDHSAKTEGYSCNWRGANASRRFFTTAPKLKPPATAGGSDKKEKSALAKDPKEYAKWLQKFPDRVAAIVAKTYAVMGDDAIKHGIPDDVALVKIMDLLNAGDDELIARNKNKKLARRPS